MMKKKQKQQQKTGNKNKEEIEEDQMEPEEEELFDDEMKEEETEPPTTLSPELDDIKITVPKEDEFLNSCFKGEYEKCNQLIKDISLTYHNNNLTPILVAAAAGHLNIVKWLFDKNFPLNSTPSPLYIAIQNGHKDVIDYLLMKMTNTDMSHVKIFFSTLFKNLNFH